jgi:hypothetical protein
MLSLLAPCLGIAVYLPWVVSVSPVEMFLLRAVSLPVIAGGFVLAVVAFFAPKGERATRKSVAGICISGLLLSFAVFSIFTHPKVAARANNAPQPPRKASYYFSGR